MSDLSPQQVFTGKEVSEIPHRIQQGNSLTQFLTKSELVESLD